MSPSRAQLEADQTVPTLQALQAEGKVRFLGMSGTLPNLPDHIAMGVFDVFQIPYSGLQREHEDLVTTAARGRRRDPDPRRGGPRRPGGGQGLAPRRLGLAEGEGKRRWESAGLADLLDGMSPIEFTLRFTLSHPELSSTIVGTSSLDHLTGNLAVAARGPLPADVYAEARRRLRGA